MFLKRCEVERLLGLTRRESYALLPATGKPRGIIPSYAVIDLLKRKARNGQETDEEFVPRLVGADEMCRLFCCRRRSLFGMLRRCRIPHYRLTSKSPKFDWGSVLRWMKPC